MKTSKIRYRRCRWEHTLDTFLNDPMCMKIENYERLILVTLKRIECEEQY